MAYQAGIITDARGNTIRIAHPDLPTYPQTALSASVAAGATSLPVVDSEGFGAGDYVLVGPLGTNTAELRLASSVVSKTAIPVAALGFSHAFNAPIYRFIWNQVEISSAATPTGTKTVVATVNLAVDQPQTHYVVTSDANNYYFARYKNSGTGNFGPYSDPAPASGFSADTLRAIKTSALNLTGDKVDHDIITDDFLNTEIANCDLNIWQEKRRWAQFYRDRVLLGQLTAGETDYALPVDISDPNTDGAIRSVTIREVGTLQKADVEQIEGLRWGTAMSPLASEANPGDTLVELESVADMNDEGSVRIGEDNVTYTGRDTLTNELIGIPSSGDGSLTAIYPAGTKVWQGGNNELSPLVFTVKPGYLSFVLPPASLYVGRNIYISYYSKPTYHDSDTDTISWPDPELYHYWLAYKIDTRKHNGTPTDAGISFKAQYEQRKQTLLSRARMQDTPKMMPTRRLPRQMLGNLANQDFVSWVIR